MGKAKNAASGTKRDSAAAAATAADEPSKKHKKAKAEQKRAEEPAKEELSEEEDEEEEEEKSAAMLCQEQLHARAVDMGAFVVLLGDLDKGDSDSEGGEGEDSDSDSDEAPSLEKLEAMTRVFLPKKAEGYLEGLNEALGEIGCTPPESEEGEDDEDGDDDEKAAMEKQLMRMFTMRGLTTRHSYPMHSIIKASLKEVDKAIKYADTDVPEEVLSIYKQLKKQWGQLKKHSEQELGSPVCEGGSSPSVKAALDKMLHRLTDNLKELDFEVE